MTLGILFGFILSYKNIVIKDKIDELSKSRMDSILGIYLIAVISTGLSRYLTRCHTPLQIVSGYFIGLLLGYIFYLIGSYVEEYSSLYVQHRSEFFEDISNIVARKS